MRQYRHGELAKLLACEKPIENSNSLKHMEFKNVYFYASAR